MRHVLVLILVGGFIVSSMLTVPGRVVAQSATPAAGADLAANKARVSRYYEMVNTGELDRLTEVLAPDFVGQTQPPDEDPGVDGLIAGREEARVGLPDVAIKVDDLVAEGNAVVARTTIRGTHLGDVFGVPPTGKAIQTTAIDLWHVEGGRLTDNWHLEDALGVMRQVGAIPSGDAATPAAAAEAAPAAAPGAVVADAATLAANKALVRRFDAEIVEGGDLAVADEILAPDFVWHYELPPGTPSGSEGVKVFAEAVRAAFADVRYAVEDVVAEGDRVAVHSLVSGTHRGEYFGIPASGRSVTIRILDIYRIADGRIAELWTVSDDLGFLMQVDALPGAGEPATPSESSDDRQLAADVPEGQGRFFGGRPSRTA
jgi:steroid delta-isomerase-like uncharacterized protein